MSLSSSSPTLNVLWRDRLRPPGLRSSWPPRLGSSSPLSLECSWPSSLGSSCTSEPGSSRPPSLWSSWPPGLWSSWPPGLWSHSDNLPSHVQSQAEGLGQGEAVSLSEASCCLLEGLGREEQASLEGLGREEQASRLLEGLGREEQASRCLWWPPCLLAPWASWNVQQETSRQVSNV